MKLPVICTFVLTAALSAAWQQQTQTAPQPAAKSPVRGRGIQPDPLHPVLPIGAPAPDFNLPGIDGKNHTLAEYASARILVIVFQSNHCPISQLFEGRIKKIQEDYKDRGLKV